MTTAHTTSAASRPATPTPDRPKTPEEAAEQFEAVLVRQFVEAMTEGLFESATASAPQAQIDAQRDALTTALTSELVESGTLRFRDLLLEQWGRDGTAEPAPTASPSATRRPAPAPPAASLPAPVRPDPRPVRMTGDDHFDLLRQAAELGNRTRRP